MVSGRLYVTLALGLRYRNTTTTRLCFEQVASVKTLVMYKGLLENAMQMKN